jgi:CubicO group peptidase (beta-lactamase class C family)
MFSNSAPHRWAAAIVPLLLVLALVAGCAPIQAPPAGTVPAPTAAPAGTVPAPAPDTLAGDWAGAIAIAGIELNVILHVAQEGDGYSATLDIPQQNAMGLPVANLEVALPNVRFTILEGAQQATFAGALGEDGLISGEFSQAGQEGTFTLARADAMADTTTDATTAPAEGTGISEIYTDTTGLWAVPVPTGWTVTPQEEFVTFQDPEREITVHIMTAPGDDQAAVIADGWQLAQPGFDLPIDQTVTPPAPEGIDQVLVYSYDTDDDNLIVQAAAQMFEGLNYIQLYTLSLEAAQRRSAQISIIDAGFNIIGAQQLDLSDKQPAELTDAIIEQWEAFIVDAQEKFEVPGAIVGVVRDGELVYAQGFGYADPVTQAPITPDMHMMIGSTGKSLTTMMMGTLVDDGLMMWDTPAQEIYPDFGVMDPDLSESITMRNLVCACTGVPRRDLEFFMNADELSATDVIASLQTFEFFTDFGEAFQYSNQMVGTGGYIAGLAAEPSMNEPMAAYTTALKERVTGPIGMENTTLSFAEVVARDNHATPHSYNALSEYVTIPLTVETTLLPIAPAGAHWSTLEDMAKYMVTQLSTGVAPDGERVISEENLLVTREPQVKVSADVSYGLGWLVGDYKGLPMIEHGGNTLGFTSDFGFLPTANLGVIVLTNAQGTNTFSTAVRVRLLELLYDVPSQVEPNLEFTLGMIEEQKAELAQQISGSLDEEAVAPFVGTYSSPVLGGLVMSLEDGKLMADFGEVVTSIVPKTDDEGEPDNYIAFDPPLAGYPFRLEMTDDGTPTVIIGAGLVEYTFTPVE